jgi:hypothetical protein
MLLNPTNGQMDFEPSDRLPSITIGKSRTMIFIEVHKLRILWLYDFSFRLLCWGTPGGSSASWYIL